METKITYRPLPTKFKGRASQKEFQFKQLKTKGNIALFQKEGAGSLYYEVIIVQKHNGRSIGGVDMPPAWFYPSDTMFGTYGWCYREDEKDRAEEKYKQLIEKK